MTDKQESSPDPQKLLGQLLSGKQLTYSLSGVARLGVADHMSAMPIAVDKIAAKVGAHAPSLYRVMRMLASMGVFNEVHGKRFALSPAGELLRSDAPGSMRYIAMMFGDPWTTRAYEHFADCLRTGQDGVSKAYGQHVFDVLAERPEQLETFQAAMTSSSTLAGHAVVSAYDFGGIMRIADVGGGHGALLASILRHYPNMQGVLFDREEIVSGVPEDQFAGCDGRIAIESGSFFERVPDGCDAYIMKHIIHDWSDEHCRTILKLMREKLPANGRVLLCEMVVTDEPGPTPAKMLDIEMLLVTVGGKERTKHEFAELLGSCGLHLSRIVATERPICVIEAMCE
ncbi:MAG: methyltransferase [Methyloceanibacter sp.]|uniref:methyltransferase n=1 Tax=Methyloceanibacter sp. TaxID=1965321 RepID=UPI003C5C3D5E